MSSLGDARAKRMERYLEKIGNSLGLSECGRKWLIMALDPFNDSLNNHDGFPNGSGAKNLVEQVKETINIVNPANNTANWDCLILQLPWELPIKIAANASQGSASTSSPNVPSNLLNIWGYQSTGPSFIGGGICIVCMPSSNNNWNPSLGTWAAFQAATTGSVTNVTPDPSYLQDNYRVTNKGFEVANTTAPLYRQGSVTLFKVPVPSLAAAAVGAIGTWTTGSVSGAADYHKVLNIDMWPANSQAAFLSTDSIQHNAEDGVYMPAHISDLDEMSDYKYDPTAPFIVSATNGENGTTNCLPFLTGLVATAPWANGGTFATGVEWSSFHMTGCLFQGLSVQTALQLNAKWGIERFPSQNNTILSPLAHDPPIRDQIALDLYAHIMQSMPVGCKFSGNGFGDWIADALGTAADFISPVLSMIPHPAAQALAHGLKATDAVSNPGRAQAAQAKRASKIDAQNAARAKANIDHQRITYGN